MKKQLFIALMCTGVLFATSCSMLKGGGLETKSYAGRWLVNPSDYDANYVDDSESECWFIDYFCDGTTIDREFMWGTESLIVFTIQSSMAADLKAHGEYTKKYWYEKVSEPTEAACDARVWEGAECFIENISWIDSLGHPQSSTEYCWIPEANMKERHDYYMSVTKQAEEATGKKTHFTHTYTRAPFNDKESCLGQNPKDSTDVPVVPPVTPKDYTQYDSVTYKCWQVTITQSVISITKYLWDNERDLVYSYDHTYGNSYSYVEADAADEDACHALQDQTQENEACWKLSYTVSYGGYSISQESYMWGLESDAQAAVNGLKQSGYANASYTKTNDSEEACNAHNNND